MGMQRIPNIGECALALRTMLQPVLLQVTPGGEEAFVLRMVDESCSPPVTDQSLWFTSMVGKLSTVDVVVSELQHRGIPTVRVRPLIQGRTRRWVVAWSWRPPTDFFADGWRFISSDVCDSYVDHDATVVQPCNKIPASRGSSDVGGQGNEEEQTLSFAQGDSCYLSASGSNDVASMPPSPSSPLCRARKRARETENGAVADSHSHQDDAPTNVRIAVVNHSTFAPSDRGNATAAPVPIRVGRHFFTAVPSRGDIHRILDALSAVTPATNAAACISVPQPSDGSDAVDVLSSIEAVLRESPPRGSDDGLVVAAWRVDRPLVACLPTNVAWRFNFAFRGVAFLDADNNDTPDPAFRFEIHTYREAASDGNADGRSLVCMCWISGNNATRAYFERLADRVTGSVLRTSRRWRRRAKRDNAIVDNSNGTVIASAVGSTT